MKNLLIILFSLLSITKNRNLRILDDSVVENNNCPDKSLTVSGYYCSYFDGTIIQASTQENCTNSNTFKCTNPKYETKEECEKTYEWIYGKCYENDKENSGDFLSNYKDKLSCEEKKADWTMTYCVFHSFSSGKIYEKLNSSVVDNKEDYFSKDVCEDTLNGVYQKEGKEGKEGIYGCYFSYGAKLNYYLCDSNNGQDEECPKTMNEEICKDLEGVEYGTCSINTIYGEGERENCISNSKYIWKTGENQSFCYENTSLTKDLCQKQVRGEWKEVYGEWKSIPEKCTQNSNAQEEKSQFLQIKIIFMILLFIFTA